MIMTMVPKNTTIQVLRWNGYNVDECVDFIINSFDDKYNSEYIYAEKSILFDGRLSLKIVNILNDDTYEDFEIYMMDIPRDDMIVVNGNNIYSCEERVLLDDFEYTNMKGR
ncbi:MAG: hypothetical protein PHT94_00730 [Candidatus Nanoarchaeia archaeon]|nr:hypothetical protein [Candidatus Nanoarchaeia archaeon]